MECALQEPSGKLLVEWLNRTKDAEGRQAVAQAVRYMQGDPAKGLPPKEAAMYFAEPLSMFTRIKGGKLDLFPNGDRSYAIFHFWRTSTAGRLGRLRRCRKCQQWFYATRSDKKWCEKHRQVTPHGEAYQRWWRIKTKNLPFAEDQILKLKDRANTHPLTKAQRERLERAEQRKRDLRAELKKLNVILSQDKAERERVRVERWQLKAVLTKTKAARRGN